MKNNLPVFALAISIVGTITNFMTEAKSLFGALAALASLIASCYAIAIAHRRLFKKESLPKSLRASRSSRAKRIRRFSILCGLPASLPLPQLIAHCSLLIAVLVLTGCSTTGPNPLSQGLDHAATALTATTTNVTAHETITAIETVTAVPVLDSELSTQNSALRYVTNIHYQTNVTLLTNITAIARPILTRTTTAGESVAPFLPSPVGEAVAAGATLLSAALAWAVRRRNTMLKTIIQGVEVGGNKEVKSAIADKALDNGVLPAIHTLVKQFTR